MPDGDGILSIGATVDKTGVEAGLSSIRDDVQVAVQSIAVQVEETTARTRAAWNKLGDDVKAAAQSVSAESIKVAEATKAQTAALADLRRASILSKDAKLDEAVSTGILAAAQDKAAAAAVAVALAKQKEAAAVAEAAEEEALSSNVIVAAFQRAALGAREALTSIQEKLVETAETGNISAEGMAAGFSGLGALIGGGLAVGFAAHFLDETAKVNVELGHLAEKTGISVGYLSGLREIVKETGGDFESISTGLIRMDKNLADSAEPSKQLTAALAGINLKVADFKGLSPEAKLELLSKALGGTENAGNRAAAAIAIFGRGGAALIPTLVQQGAELDKNVKHTAELTGVTDKSIAASQEWTRNMAKLTEGFQNFGNFAIENMHFVFAVIDAGGALLRTVFEGIATGIIALGKEFFSFGKLVYDALHFNVSELQSDLQNVIHVGVDAAKAGGKDIAQAWRDNAKLWHTPAGVPGGAGAGGDADDAAAGGGAGGGGGAGRAGGGKAAAAFGPPVLAAAPQTQSADLSGASAEFIAEQQKELKAAQDTTRAMMEGDRAAAEEKMRMAAEDYADVEKTTAFEVRMGQMTAEQRIAVLRAAATQEQQIRLQQSAFIQALDMNDLKKYEDDLKAQETAARQSARQIQAINQDAALQMQQKFQQAFTAMTGPLNTFVDHWLTSGRQMGVAFVKMADQMAMNFINAEIKMLEHHLQMAIQKRVITQTNNAAEVASNATAAATTTAVDQKTAMQSLAASAASAAGKAWQALSGIPIVGPALGAGAAAATYAGVMALGVFDQGGIMGTGQMGVNLSGADERVLNPAQTANFEKMVNQSTSSSSSQELHFHDHSNWSGVDGASVEGMYRQHAAAGRRQMMRQLRLANKV